jgi:predicted transcriptional regulator
LDSYSARCAALMSIHPEFARRIVVGEKLAEFRRRSATRPVSHILVYATAPVRAIVAVAEVERVERGSPRSLWKSFRDVSGIERTAFFDYFAGVNKGVAYVLGPVWSCTVPVALGCFGLPRAAPQAFQYVSAETLDAVLQRSTTSLTQQLRAAG